MIAARPAHTVVANLNSQLPLLDSGRDCGAICTSMLDDVCQCFAHHEIRRRFNCGREALDSYVHAHGQREPRHERLDSRSQSSARERHGQNAVRQLAQL